MMTNEKSKGSLGKVAPFQLSLATLRDNRQGTTLGMRGGCLEKRGFFLYDEGNKIVFNCQFALSFQCINESNQMRICILFENWTIGHSMKIEN